VHHAPNTVTVLTLAAAGMGLALVPVLARGRQDTEHRVSVRSLRFLFRELVTGPGEAGGSRTISQRFSASFEIRAHPPIRLSIGLSVTPRWGCNGCRVAAS